MLSMWVKVLTRYPNLFSTEFCRHLAYAFYDRILCIVGYMSTDTTVSVRKGSTKIIQYYWDILVDFGSNITLSISMVNNKFVELLPQHCPLSLGHTGRLWSNIYLSIMFTIRYIYTIYYKQIVFQMYNHSAYHLRVSDTMLCFTLFIRFVDYINVICNWQIYISAQMPWGLFGEVCIWNKANIRRPQKLSRMNYLCAYTAHNLYLPTYSRLIGKCKYWIINGNMLDCCWWYERMKYILQIFHV